MNRPRFSNKGSTINACNQHLAFPGAASFPFFSTKSNLLPAISAGPLGENPLDPLKFHIASHQVIHFPVEGL